MIALLKLWVLMPVAFARNANHRFGMSAFSSRSGVEVSRKTQENQNCPIMELKANCRQYFFAIWDNDGNFVYDSYLDGIDYAECYDPSKCYRIELVSESGDCEYQVIMDGKTEASGVTKYNPGFVGDIIYAGEACTTNCPGQAELILITYFDYYDMPYTLHVADDSDYSGTVAEGDSIMFCIDLDKCNIMAREKLGFSFFYLTDGDTGATIDNGGFEKFRTFGTCPSDCPQYEVAVLITATSAFNYTYSQNGIISQAENLLPGQSSELLCVNNASCHVLDGTGSALYYFFEDEEVFDKGLNTEYRDFGECETFCDTRPVLSSTARGQEMVSILATISGMEAIADFNTDRYRATCWLIYDDLRQLEANDPRLVQRYTLALFYLTTQGKYWFNRRGFMSGKDECDWEAVTGCNEDNLVTQVYLANNNLTGTFASEIFSLLALELFEVDQNSFTGTFPVGLSRLANIRDFGINDNKFTGTVPNDIMDCTQFEILSIKGNLFSGTIPSVARDFSTIGQFWGQDNLFTGTIPSWVADAQNLTHLYVHQNRLSGTISETILDLPVLKAFHCFENDLTGTLPENIFMGANLKEIQINNNMLTGMVPNNFINNGLTKVLMNDNQFTGVLPSGVAKLEKLKQFNINRNFLSGTFPSELGQLANLDDMRVENNNMTGTIPFEDCAQFTTLSSDCTVPQNMDCACCTRCFGLFTTYEDVLPCPSSEVQLFYDTKVNDRISYYLENQAQQLILEDFKTSRTVGLNYESCISPTDCFTLESNGDANFFVSIDEVPLLEDVENPAKISFGYSSAGGMAVDSCDDFLVCNGNIRAGSSKRKLLNMLTKFDGVDIFGSKSSTQYSALCWWLDDLDRLSEAELQNTALIQRYLLALLYFATGGLDWDSNTNWLTSASECTWYGVFCDIYPGVVNKVDLSNNNLVGILPHEIGELRGIETLILSNNKFTRTLPKEIVKLAQLKKLDLSNNRFDGTIHSEIKFLNQIKHIDLSSNRFSSTLPVEFGVLPDLEYMNFTDNAFSGDIPVSFADLRKVKSLSLSKNLFNGNLDMIEQFNELENLEASYNYFTGSLPIFGESQGNLKRLYLNNNQFSGAIPSEVDKLTSIEEFIMSANEITGSLPSQLGKLRNITMLSVSYNLLKGTITPELTNIKTLKLLHLHSNALEGEADYFDYGLESFITDCGTTEVAPAPVDCVACTQCCNVDGNCITGARTWPQGTLYEIRVRSALLVIMISLAASSVLIIFAVLLSIAGPKLPRLPYAVRKDFNDGSVFRFYLCKNKVSWILATLSVLFELWIIYVFLEAGDISEKGNLWLYSEICPDDSLECENYSITTGYGWFTFAAILATFLLPDLLNGVLLFYECSVDFDLQGLVTSMTLLCITVLSIVASTIFIYATSISNIAIIKDAVIVLFLNSIDEQFYMIVQRAAPGWVEDIETEIIEFSIYNITQEISEIIDFESDEEDEQYKGVDKEDIGMDVNDFYHTDAEFIKEDDFQTKRDFMDEQFSDEYEKSFSQKNEPITGTVMGSVLESEILEPTLVETNQDSTTEKNSSDGDSEDNAVLSNLKEEVKRMEEYFKNEIKALKEKNLELESKLAKNQSAVQEKK